MLGSLFGPTGLTLQDIAATGPQVTELFSGSRDGPAVSHAGRPDFVQPVLTVWDVELPSGAHGLLAGWAVDPDGDTPRHEQTLLSIRPDSFDRDEDLVATRMALPALDGLPAADVLVLAGPAGAVRAEVLDAAGAVLASTDLVLGLGVVPTPVGAVTVRVSAGDGGVRASATVEQDRDRTAFGDHGPDTPPVLTAVTG
jgi:hypothetical protein